MQLADIFKLLLSAILLSPLAAVASTAKDCQKALDNAARLEITQLCPAVISNNDTEMAYRIGEAFDFLDQLPNHSQQALKWYTRSAEQGHPLAQRNLAALYDGGYGIPRDPFQAFHWYQQAAQQGQPHSQLMTGMMYLYGTGTAQDAEQAKEWFQQAAHSGESNGQYMLGKISYESDPSSAISWFEKSAEQNNRYALYQLGLLHYKGDHLLENDQQALSYAERSLRAGHDKARLLKEKILARMTNQQPNIATKDADKSGDKDTEQPEKTRAVSTQKKDPLNHDDSHWLLTQPESNYTIQLALMSQYTSIQRFGRLYPEVKDTHHFLSRFPKGNRYVLLKGSYDNLADAKAALSALPDKVQQMRPWVRQFTTLQEQYVKPD